MKNVCHSGLPESGHPPDVCVGDGDGEADEADGVNGEDDGDGDSSAGEMSGRGDMVKKDCATNGDDH